MVALTSAVLVAEVGEAPDVSEADGVADAAEHEVALGAPLSALVVLGGRLHRGAIALLLVGRLSEVRRGQVRSNRGRKGSDRS